MTVNSFIITCIALATVVIQSLTVSIIAKSGVLEVAVDAAAAFTPVADG